MGLGQARKPVSGPLSSFYGASTSAGAPRCSAVWGLSITLPGGVIVVASENGQ